MKSIRWLVLLMALALLGCDEPRQSGAQPAASRDGRVAGAAAGIGQAQQKALRAIDLTAINKAIEDFYLQEGRFPKALSELEEKNYVRALPTLPEGWSLNYDTNSGVATLQRNLGNQ